MRIDAGQEQEPKIIQQHGVLTPYYRDTQEHKTIQRTREAVGQKDEVVTQHRLKQRVQDSNADQEIEMSRPIDISTEIHEEEGSVQSPQVHAQDEIRCAHVHKSGFNDDTSDSDDTIEQRRHAKVSTVNVQVVHTAEHEAALQVKGRAMRARITRVQYHEHSPVRVTGKRLRRLKNIKGDNCKLAIGPSQQYEGGEELYLDKEVCKKGAILTYYTGKVISEQEKVSSTSRYIFEIPNGTDEPIYIDAADSNCGYGRYADDAMGSETENAKREVIGTSAGVRLALIAITTIRKGMPIRAPYGWQYWYCPGNFPKELMQKAFRGYLEEIAADDNEELAWAFATATDFQDILIAKWGGTRGFATVDATDDSGNIHCVKSSIAGQTENITLGKRSVSDNESEAKDLEQHTSQETRKRRREDAGLDLSDRQHKRTRRLRDRAIEQNYGI